MDGSSTIEAGAGVSHRPPDEVWKLAQASNEAYDMIVSALGKKTMEAGADGSEITADILLSDEGIDSGNIAAGDFRDLFKGLVGKVHGYYEGVEAEEKRARVRQSRSNGKTNLTQDKAVRLRDYQPDESDYENDNGVTAKGKTDEELEDFTEMLIENMRGRLDNIHADYHPEKLAEGKRRSERTKDIKLLIKKGDEKYELTALSGDYFDLDDDLRLLIAVGNANGPMQAPRQNTAEKRRRYITFMMNRGRESSEHLTPEQIDVLISEAEESGDVSLRREGDPKLTIPGFEQVKNSGLKDKKKGDGFNNK